MYFTVMSMIHFELIFVKSARSGCRLFSFFFLFFFFFFFGMWRINSVFPAPFVGDTVFAVLCCLCSFVKDQLTVFKQVYFWALRSIPLIYLSIPSPIPHCLDDCNFTERLEVR